MVSLVTGRITFVCVANQGRVDNTKSKSQGRNAALDQVDRKTIFSELINARWGRRLD